VDLARLALEHVEAVRVLRLIELRMSSPDRLDWGWDLDRDLAVLRVAHAEVAIRVAAFADPGPRDEEADISEAVWNIRALSSSVLDDQTAAKGHGNA
jgi:hypothetical protein